MNECCKICGETDPKKFYRRKNRTISRKQCAKCWNKRTIERTRKNKLIAIEYKGGKCQKCGYDKCPSALAFHHRNPDEKDFNWKTLRSMSLDKLKKELDKCDLVCHNCHAEIHWEWDNESKLEPTVHPRERFDMFEKIQRLAYSKWEKAGYPEGDGVDFWLEAENEVNAEAEVSSAPPKTSEKKSRRVAAKVTPKK